MAAIVARAVKPAEPRVVSALRVGAYRGQLAFKPLPLVAAHCQIFLCRPALCPSICRKMKTGIAPTPDDCSPKLSQKVLAHRRSELESIITLQRRFPELAAARCDWRPIGAPALSCSRL